MPRRKSIAASEYPSLLDFRPVVATPEPVDPGEYGLGELPDFTLFGRVASEIAAAAFFADRL